jgi:hypothetical protein
MNVFASGPNLKLLTVGFGQDLVGGLGPGEGLAAVVPAGDCPHHGGELVLVGDATIKTPTVVLLRWPAAPTTSDEIARRPAATRQVFTDELMGVIDDLASRLEPIDAEAARTNALRLIGMMVGSLQLARALTDRNLSDQLLARGLEKALRLLYDRA